MASANDKPKSDSRPSGIGPGERLQAARIQQGLSLEDVAGRMHLSTNILEAIEENNFDEITAPIFVKGYLRAYARIVSLDEDEMIRQYVDFYSEEDPPISSTSNMAPELSVADARIKWTTYFVIVILAALLAAWWWNKQQVQDTSISLDSQAEVEAPIAGAGDKIVSEIEAVSEQLDTEVLSQSEAMASSTAAAPPASTLSSETAATPPSETTATPSSEPAEGAAAPAAEETATAAADISTESAGESQPATTDTAVTTTSPRAGLIVAQIAPSGSDKLRVTVHADSWADIKDATGFQLAYDLLRANDSLELIGEAPFSVFLGNGHGVELQVNGEDVDLASRIRNDNTARLKVGP